MIDYKCPECKRDKDKRMCPRNCYRANLEDGVVSSEREYEEYIKHEAKYSYLAPSTTGFLE